MFTAYEGPGTSNAGGTNAPRDSMESIDGKVLLVEELNGAYPTGSSTSIPVVIRAGVMADGDFLSPRPHDRASRVRARTVRASGPDMVWGGGVRFLKGLNGRTTVGLKG